MNRVLLLAIIMLMAIPASITSTAKETNKETIVLTVNPPMSCQNCENKIKSNIRFEKGVGKIVTDLKAQTVTVTFDPRKTDKEKIIKAFKKIGYTASESCLKNQEASESGECCRQESADCH